MPTVTLLSRLHLSQDVVCRRHSPPGQPRSAAASTARRSRAGKASWMSPAQPQVGVTTQLLCQLLVPGLLQDVPVEETPRSSRGVSHGHSEQATRATRKHPSARTGVPETTRDTAKMNMVRTRGHGDPGTGGHRSSFGTDAAPVCLHVLFRARRGAGQLRGRALAQQAEAQAPAPASQMSKEMPSVWRMGLTLASRISKRWPQHTANTGAEGDPGRWLRSDRSHLWTSTGQCPYCNEKRWVHSFQRPHAYTQQDPQG